MKYRRNQKYKSGNYNFAIIQDKDWKKDDIFKEVQKSKQKLRRK